MNTSNPCKRCRHPRAQAVSQAVMLPTIVFCSMRTLQQPWNDAHVDIRISWIHTPNLKRHPPLPQQF